MELPGLPLEVSYGKPGSLNYLLFSLLGGSLRGAKPPCDGASRLATGGIIWEAWIP